MTLTKPRVRLVRLTIAAVLATAVMLLAPHAHAENLPVPPTGGLTQGVAGTDDPAALVAAQSYQVEAVSMLDPGTQQWLVYIPGAPSQVNSLRKGVLKANSIVTIRRAGDLPATLPAPVAAPAAPSGSGTAFAAPPPGGLVVGVAGTNDPATVASAQAFPVEAISALDVPSQTWLVYVPGAPPFASTLRTGMITAESVVTVRRTSPPTPAPVPSVPGDADPAAEATILQLMNEARAAAGLSPLVIDPAIATAARLHSLDMVVRNFFGHINPDGLDAFQRMRNAGATFVYAGENITPATSATDAHAKFMSSSAHSENLLWPQYRRVGVGVVRGGNLGLLVTVDFAD